MTVELIGRMFIVEGVVYFSGKTLHFDRGKPESVDTPRPIEDVMTELFPILGEREIRLTLRDYKER